MLTETKKAKTMSEFLTLPEVVLIKIIKQLPVYEQKNICLACKYLYQIHQSIQRALCNEVRSLRIDASISLYAYKSGDIEFHQLNTGHDLYVKVRDTNVRPQMLNIFPTVFSKNENNKLTESTTRQYDFYLNEASLFELSKRYPNVCRLTLLNTMEKVDITWWPALTDIKLLGIYTPTELTNQLNKLKSVRNLSVEMELENVEKLKIMPHLRKLNCRLEPGNEASTKVWADRVNQIVDTNANLESIGLWIEYFKNGDFRFSENVLRKLNRLTYRQPMMVSDFDWITDHFHSLQYLDIEMPNQRDTLIVTYMISQLPKLSKLTEFKFCYYSRPSGAFYDAEIQKAVLVPLVVPSVKKVQVLIKVNFHSLHCFQKIFPNAQVTFVISSHFFPAFEPLFCNEQNCICQAAALLIAECKASKSRTVLLPVKPWTEESTGEVGQISNFLHLT